MLTNRDDEYHGILLARELFARLGEVWISNRNELKPRRRLSVFGELCLVSV